MAQKTVSNDGPRIDSSDGGGGNGIPRRLIIDVLLLLSREWKEGGAAKKWIGLKKCQAPKGNSNKPEVRLYDRPTG